MPTPITHLVLAEAILAREDLPPPVRCWLREQRGPFLLGHVCPDVQTVSGQARTETHFYTIPRSSDRPAYQTMFDAFPQLADAQGLPPAQAAFVAGYGAHLLLDELWLERIFLPYFFEARWSTWEERAFLHNVLRTWVDFQDQHRLNGNVGGALRETVPRGWLPFVADAHLRTWRSLLTEQLEPGRRIQTAEVFARRMGVAAVEIQAVLDSPRQMEERIFCHVSRGQLADFRREGYERTVVLLQNYLGGGG